MEFKILNPFISTGRFIKEGHPIISSGVHEKKIGDTIFNIVKKKPMVLIQFIIFKSLFHIEKQQQFL
jgi:hypothetical protein